jgi:hypothetical protein
MADPVQSQKFLSCETTMLRNVNLPYTFIVVVDELLYVNYIKLAVDPLKLWHVLSALFYFGVMLSVSSPHKNPYTDGGDVECSTCLGAGWSLICAGLVVPY